MNASEGQGKENTKAGELATRMREVLKRIEDIKGYRVQVLKKSGTPLKLMFLLSMIGEGQKCDREDCKNCIREGRGVKFPPFKKRTRPSLDS